MVTVKFVLVFVLVAVIASCVYGKGWYWKNSPLNGLTLGGGEYVPKSYYVIDHFGHQSRPVYVRSKRDLMNIPLFRVKRGGSASSGSYASAGSSANAGAGAGAPVYFNGKKIQISSHVLANLR